MSTSLSLLSRITDWFSSYRESLLQDDDNTCTKEIHDLLERVPVSKLKLYEDNKLIPVPIDHINAQYIETVVGPYLWNQLEASARKKHDYSRSVLAALLICFVRRLRPGYYLRYYSYKNGEDSVRAGHCSYRLTLEEM